MRESFVPSLREYAAHFQIDTRRLGPRQLLMHPGPVNRGVELSGEAIDSPQSLIAEQVASGLVVRMAILYELLAAGDERAGARRRPTAPAGRPRSGSQRELDQASTCAPGRAPTSSCAAPRCSTRSPASKAATTSSSATAASPSWPSPAPRTPPALEEVDAEGPARLPRLLRPPRPPARSRPGAQGGHRDRGPRGRRGRLLRRPRDGQHRAARLRPGRCRGAAGEAARERRLGPSRLPRHRHPRRWRARS